MTMKIIIRNTDEDQSRSAKVVIHDHANNGEQTIGDMFELAPGQNAEVWIHGTRSVTVHEVKKS